MSKLGLEKAEEPEWIPNIHWITEKAREFQKNIYLCFIDYTKAFDCVDHNNCGKLLKRWEYQTILPASWETCMQVKRQQLEPDIEAWTRSKLGKKYGQGCILSPCLFNLYAEYIMRNAGWIKHKLESRLPGEISITSDMQMNNAQHHSLLEKCKSKPQCGTISSQSEWLLSKRLQAINAGEWVWRKGNPLTLLVGMQTSTATMENSVKIP